MNDQEEKIDKALDNLIEWVIAEDNPENVDFRKAKREVQILVEELINSEVLSALDQIKKPTMEEVWPSKPYGDSSYEDILKALGWYSKQIESIKNRYKL